MNACCNTIKQVDRTLMSCKLINCDMQCGQWNSISISSKSCVNVRDMTPGFLPTLPSNIVKFLLNYSYWQLNKIFFKLNIYMHRNFAAPSPTCSTALPGRLRHRHQHRPPDDLDQIRQGSDKKISSFLMVWLKLCYIIFSTKKSISASPVTQTTS